MADVRMNEKEIEMSEHLLEIVDEGTGEGPYGVCSCGWQTPPMASMHDVARLYNAHTKGEGEPEEFNGRACSYFARWMNEPGHDPDATCSFECEEEPECVTYEPEGGWPPLAIHDEGASG